MVWAQHLFLLFRTWVYLDVICDASGYGCGAVL
jgi:hypothetical protein